MTLNIDIDDVAVSDIPSAIAQLAAAQAQLAAKLMKTPEPEATPETDRMLKAEEVADQLRRSVKWVSRHRGSLPFAKKLASRSWVYSEAGLKKWLAARRK
jgi:hypothetical protein